MAAVDLICIDVDGTLLGSDGAVADEVWTALSKLRQQGMRLAICSGRPAFGVTLEYARKLDPAGWHIFQNGASVVRPETGETRSRLLDPAIVTRLIERSEETGRVLELYADHEMAVQHDANRARRHADVLGIPFRPRPYADLAGRVVRGQWLLPHSEREAIWDEPLDGLNLCPSLSPLMPDTVFASMTATGVDKGSALANVADAYGVPLSRVMMIGDSENDLPALQIAGVAVAMGNAEPEVLATAHHTVDHVDEGGLLEALAMIRAT